MTTGLLSAVDVSDVSHRYAERLALDAVSLSVPVGEIFGLLGPNGGGKTTLFRLLTTLVSVQAGRVAIFGREVSDAPHEVRRLIGVTFQSPSLDGKLTAGENLRLQGAMYGLSGSALARRIETLAAMFGIADRLTDRVDALSGGLKRRVELAKSLLHEPRLLILDEPSTGLDPGARLDLWAALTRLRDEQGVTVVLTTHLMEEAERCDRLGLLDRGRLVALGTPDELRRSLGGDALTIQTRDPEGLAARIVERFGLTPRLLENGLRIEHAEALTLLRDLAAAFPQEIDGLSLAKPTLEDVFIARTGHRFWDAV